MPLFMDVHHKADGLTAEAVAGAHQKDLETQGKYGVDDKSYWFRRELGQGVLPRAGAGRRGSSHGAPGGARAASSQPWAAASGRGAQPKTGARRFVASRSMPAWIAASTSS